MVKEIVGAIPRDENFYDREDLIREMWDIVECTITSEFFEFKHQHLP